MRSSGRSRVVFAVRVDVRVDRLVLGSHRLRENRVHVAFGSTGLEHGGPVEFAGLMLGLTGHHRTLGIDHGRFSLFKRMTVNIIRMATRTFSRTRRVDKVRALLLSSHPGSSVICRGRIERVSNVTIVQPMDRGHRISQRRLLRGTRSASRSQRVAMAIHVRVAISRTRDTIGRRNGITDFFLNGFCSIGSGLRPFQVRLRMREVARSSGVAAA